MPDTNINLVDDSLKVLLQAGTDFPNAEIDFCVGYVTASGVLLLKKMFNTAHKARAVVGCRLTHKSAKRGRYVSEEENGEDTRQIPLTIFAQCLRSPVRHCTSMSERRNHQSNHKEITSLIIPKFTGRRLP